NDPNVPIVGGRGLILSGNAKDEPSVIVSATTRVIDDPQSRDYAIAIANGDLLITGSYQLGGDVLVFGDARLLGEGSFQSTQPRDKYVVEAARNPFANSDTESGELTMGGVSGADQNVVLVGRGDAPSDTNQHPAGIHLLGNFNHLAKDLELDG